MTTEIPKQFEPQSVEAAWIPYWESNGYFNADPDSEKPPHVIMIPLPNVTGALHMGHALNGTLQDLITRWRRMQGYEALWMPGTDHAGIATQSVVERRLLEEEGKTRHDIGREALVERIWKWKESYEKRILGQLKRIGASCDWRRVRFTLDDVCSKAVRRTFFKMFRDGLIFRGKRLVNWDAFLQTAVADDEVYSEDIAGQFWTFNYPVVDDAGNDTGERISFSTTRPETMLGDTALCVHPTDERYTALVGKQVRIPVIGRLIPIIADALLADKELGTGCVKVTPAHDPNDYACGLRNKLPMINILNPDGTINGEGGEFAGLDRFDARARVVAEMQSLGHFEKVEDRQIPLKYSDRSKTPIEPYLSDQWFVKMDELAQKAIDAVDDGRVQFFPERYKSSYLDWLGEKRDWCISRQLWWGHRISVWRKTIKMGAKPDAYLIATQIPAYESVPTAPHGVKISDTYKDFVADQIMAGPEVDELTLLWCIDSGHSEFEKEAEKLGFVQDEDVLDTWFSSALWPHATLGWPDTEHNPPLAASAATSPTSARSLVEDAFPVVPLTGMTISPEAIVAVQADWARKHQAMPIAIEEDVLVVAFADEIDQERIDAIRFHANRELKVVLATASDVNAAIDRHYDSSSTLNAQPSTGTTNAVLNYFYPGSVLITSRDIITLWVARMVLTGLYNMGDVPFKHVHVHPKILDGFGQGMSKSKGNGVDPLELIERYGCDGMRFTIASFAGETQDVRLPVGYECPHCQAPIPQQQEHLKFKPGKPRIKCPKCKKESQYACPYYEPDEGEPVARIVIERFEYGRNFANKLWNAARFALLNLEGYTPGPVADSELHLEDRWVLSRLATVADEVTELLGKYQFDAATRSLREFVWNEFCDWYLEMIKPRLRDEARKPAAQRVLVHVLDTILRLLHPFTPFITEELWHRLKEIAPQRGLPSPTEASPACIVAPWPTDLGVWRQPALEARFQRLQELIVAVRNVRGTYNISPAASLSLVVRCPAEAATDLTSVADQLSNLARAELTAAGPDAVRPKSSASFSLGDIDGYIPLEGLIDVAAEITRQQKEAEKLRGFIAGSEKKLTNSSFVDRAPPEVVAEVRSTLENLKKQLASVEDVLQQLAGN
ncbi:valine--tRNA ligase [Planctellipticum variicoloris]|uniref:valine--tRNA ligase n=1 Tax=Planctellipticum variicoloris TaxID=3064265 RepID=UPI0030135B65|nr:class I tRNA ligase family protein [Planctomycetaceae bacterium SH412]